MGTRPATGNTALLVDIAPEVLSVPRMIAPDPHCKGATVGRTGRAYRPDRAGFFRVESAKDVAEMKAHGFVQAGSTPVIGGRKWVCEGCGWEAVINSCPHCHRSDLRKVEG